MEAVEEGEDTNHIMVLPSNGASNPAGEGGGGEQGGEKFQKPKPRMQVEIRQAPNKTLQLAFQASHIPSSFWATDWMHYVKMKNCYQLRSQGVYKRVAGEDQPKNGKLDTRLRISTKGSYLWK